MSVRRQASHEEDRLRSHLADLRDHLGPNAQARVDATLALNDTDFLRAAHDAHLDLQVTMAHRTMHATEAPVPSYFARELLRPAGLMPPANAFRNWLSMQEWYEGTSST